MDDLIFKPGNYYRATRTIVINTAEGWALPAGSIVYCKAVVPDFKSLILAQDPTEDSSFHERELYYYDAALVARDLRFGEEENQFRTFPWKFGVRQVVLDPWETITNGLELLALQAREFGL